MILIKLGGSVLTDKSIPFSFDEAVTRRLSKEIKDVDDDIIVIHGGGSFGHPGARKYKFNTDNPAEPPRGTAEVQRDMRKMNQEIIDIMIDEDINAVSIPGGLIARYRNGEIVSFDEDIFIDHLTLGTTPVAFGDVALDQIRGVTICSGDDIMNRLGYLANVSIFVTNVDGVFKNGEVVDIFKEGMLPLTEDDMPGEKKTIDVTGSMERKLKLMLNMSDRCKTYVVNGLIPGRLKSLLNKEKTLCTMVER
ncbi:MAG: isopentenyl phosphate kinase [Thermoplasmata archaeon]